MPLLKIAGTLFADQSIVYIDCVFGTPVQLIGRLIIELSKLIFIK